MGKFVVDLEKLASIAKRKADVQVGERVRLLAAELEQASSKIASRGLVGSGAHMVANLELFVGEISLRANLVLHAWNDILEAANVPMDGRIRDRVLQDVTARINADHSEFIQYLRKKFTTVLSGRDIPDIDHARKGAIEKAAVDLEIAALRVSALSPTKTALPPPTPVGARPSVFICHASEDKEGVVRELAHALRDRGITVWYDEFSVRLGESIRRTIEKGLSECKAAIVVLSPNFFKKPWPQTELDGLMDRVLAGEIRLFPVWHEVDGAYLRAQAPMLSGLLAAKTSAGITAVVETIVSELKSVPATSPEEELVILWAKYGAHGRFWPVTRYLRERVVDGKLRILVNNDLWGDPIENVPKVLTVKWTYRGKPGVRDVRESEWLELP